ncbi:TRAP transporter small permease [Fluviibacterium sp. S390]|uniref:TRAP transporter small permease n=1 Tax=Fluviibacterium sp. S390 TaxID=3415139 RepID=UPI003C7B9FFD
MPILLALLRPFEIVNTAMGRLGRGVTVVAMALMVIVILIQVVFRYVLNNALPWPDEAARFLMLWMTGLIAPYAFRRGGFVAIDMVERALPKRPAALLSLVLLSLSLVVLIVGVRLGYNHTMSGCLFKSSTLWMPFTFSFAMPLPGLDMSLTLCTKADATFGLTWGWAKMPLAMMYASLYVGLILLVLVNVELLLRGLATLLGREDHLRPLPRDVVEAE